MSFSWLTPPTIGSQKGYSRLFVPHDFFGESEKRHFRFPYKSMTYTIVIDLGALDGAR